MKTYLNENILTIFFHASGHKFIDQFIVFRTMTPGLVKPNVMRIISQLFIVCANIDRNWKALMRFYTGQSGIKS